MLVVVVGLEGEGLFCVDSGFVLDKGMVPGSGIRFCRRCFRSGPFFSYIVCK